MRIKFNIKLNEIQGTKFKNKKNQENDKKK